MKKKHVILKTPRRAPSAASPLFQAWEPARDDAHDAFLLWCEAPYGAKREGYVAYRADAAPRR